MVLAVFHAQKIETKGLLVFGLANTQWLVGRVVRESGDISAEYTEVFVKKFANWLVNETTLDAFPPEFFHLAAGQYGDADPQQDRGCGSRPIGRARG